MSKLLTVFGATGLQGSSLISHVLQHPQLSTVYRVRGITRDETKAAAVALRGRGVEIVKADMNDERSLQHAVEGSYAVFGVTNFWESCSPTLEIAQGRAIASAAVAANVSLLIWSSLPSVTEMTGGKLRNVHHFDSKAAVETYIRTLNIRSVFFWAGWYMQNFESMMRPVAKPDGTFVFAQPWAPSTSLPMIDITDTGKFLAPALLEPDKYAGKTFACAATYYSPREIADGWSKGTGKTVVFEQLPDVTHDGGDDDAVAASGNEGMTVEMRETLKDVQGLITEYSYFGPGGKEKVKWTLGQMEEGEGARGWEEFVRRGGAAI